ncbi:phytanoyl-CoA dioxygenase family protein [Roseobacter sp. CCS2]|uniref:phytanoyl-CoA dioxygenase family protein n=1 Tax=Roseobacter sp. CCS2 TaxID=391593 RepID=UPI0000F401C4|nr:phytanoyl-CoA dioxygenase family protein [Roseobacter sp. CCS2]EBA13005.1 hypothetical protein RCCS2_03949 [Roseobacter sp. CCS2]
MRQRALTDGMLWLRHALRDGELSSLDQISTSANMPGSRKQLDNPTSTALSSVTGHIRGLDQRMSPVRLVAFDKTATSNWGLPWHQDRVIAVNQKHDVPGYGNWSCKKGVWHCEPPVSLLKEMLFVRVHLDDTSEEDGAMEIALGSHRDGKVMADQSQAVADRYPKHVCPAQRGDILILDMLTLHRSLPATVPSTRRTLRIDYAAVDLPPPLAWPE